MAKAIISTTKTGPKSPTADPGKSRRLSWSRTQPPSPAGVWTLRAVGRATCSSFQSSVRLVDQWRDDGYSGASEVTQRLFAYWFEEDHEVAGFAVPFHYHFCQREAIEILAYLVEVACIRDAKALVDAYAEVFHRDLLSKSVEFQTTMDGRHQIRRYVPELESEGHPAR